MKRLISAFNADSEKRRASAAPLFTAGYGERFTGGIGYTLILIGLRIGMRL